MWTQGREMDCLDRYLISHSKKISLVHFNLNSWILQTLRKIHVHNSKLFVLRLHYTGFIANLLSNEVLLKLMGKFFSCYGIPKQKPQMIKLQAGMNIVLCKVHRNGLHVQELEHDYNLFSQDTEVDWNFVQSKAHVWNIMYYHDVPPNKFKY